MERPLCTRRSVSSARPIASDCDPICFRRCSRLCPPSVPLRTFSVTFPLSRVSANARGARQLCNIGDDAGSWCPGPATRRARRAPPPSIFEALVSCVRPQWMHRRSAAPCTLASSTWPLCCPCPLPVHALSRAFRLALPFTVAGCESCFPTAFFSRWPATS